MKIIIENQDIAHGAEIWTLLQSKIRLLDRIEKEKIYDWIDHQLNFKSVQIIRETDEGLLMALPSKILEEIFEFHVPDLEDLFPEAPEE